MSRADNRDSVAVVSDPKPRRDGLPRYADRAYVVKVGGRYFGGFGGRPPGPYVVKLNTKLADALLCDHPNKAADYVTRLAQRGFTGATVHPVRET